MKIIIERYQKQDYTELKEMIQAVLAEYDFEFGIGGLENDLNALNRNDAYKDNKEAFWVVKDANQVIGSIAIRSRDDDLAELKRFYLRKEYRGFGIGSKLYDVAENFAIKKDYSGIWLESSRRFKLAEKLYKRKEYKLIEVLDNDWEDNIYQKLF